MLRLEHIVLQGLLDVHVLEILRVVVVDVCRRIQELQGYLKGLVLLCQESLQISVGLLGVELLKYFHLVALELALSHYFGLGAASKLDAGGNRHQVDSIAVACMDLIGQGARQETQSVGALLHILSVVVHHLPIRLQHIDIAVLGIRLIDSIDDKCGL